MRYKYKHILICANATLNPILNCKGYNNNVRKTSPRQTLKKTFQKTKKNNIEIQLLFVIYSTRMCLYLLYHLHHTQHYDFCYNTIIAMDN
jgi:hypothetical protein